MPPRSRPVLFTSKVETTVASISSTNPGRKPVPRSQYIYNSTKTKRARNKCGKRATDGKLSNLFALTLEFVLEFLDFLGIDRLSGLGGGIDVGISNGVGSIELTLVGGDGGFAVGRGGGDVGSLGEGKEGGSGSSGGRGKERGERGSVHTGGGAGDGPKGRLGKHSGDGRGVG